MTTSSLWRAFGGLLLVVGGALAGDPPRIDATWLQRVKTEGAEALARYQRAENGIESRQLCRGLQFRGDATQATLEFTTIELQVTLGDSMLDQMDIVFPDPKRRPMCKLLCRNERYSFVLRRKDPTASHFLDQMAELPELAFTDQIRSSAAIRPIVALISLLDAIAGKEGGRLIRLEAVPGTNRIRAEYHTTVMFNPPNKETLHNDCELDPHSNWRCVSQQVTGTTRKYAIKDTYGYEVDGLSYPKSSRYEMPPKGNKPGYIEETDFEYVRRTTRSRADFYLTTFGFPEPPGIVPPSRPTPTYVWLLLGAGGFGAIALACRWLLKRRAKVALPPPVPPTA